MKITDAIAQLSEILAQTGDVELVSFCEIGDKFCIEYGRVFEVISPDDDGTWLCAYMEAICDHDDGRPKLKLVKK